MFKTLLVLLLISVTCAAKNIVILEIDRGISLSHFEVKSHINQKNWNKIDYKTNSDHGNHIAGIILKNVCPEVELRSCMYVDNFYTCLVEALANPPNIINISAGGEEYDKQEFTLLKQLTMPIIVAAGNNGKNLLFPGNNYYPAKYELKNIIPVGNLSQDGIINISSNYGLQNEVYEIGTDVDSTLPNGKYGKMSGTSQATAKYTNKLLLQMCKDLENKKD